eukprot:m.334218 g.334218  ORF g.334218 m.334218 type:complete len:684 (+) comp27750_c0_seq7:161-2212(+)
MQCGNAQMSPHNCTALPRPTAPESVRMRTNGILTAQIASHGPTQAAKLSGCTMTDVVDVGADAPITKLNNHCLANIFHQLETRVLVNIVPAVCQSWRSLCRGAHAGAPVMFDIVLTGRDRCPEKLSLDGTLNVPRQDDWLLHKTTSGWILNVLLSRFRYTIRNIDAKYLNVERSPREKHAEDIDDDDGAWFLDPEDYHIAQGGIVNTMTPYFSKVAMDVAMSSIAAASSHRLRSLDLSGSRGVTNNAVNSIVDVCHGLQIIRLSRTAITDKAVWNLLTKSKDLVELDVQECESVRGTWLDDVGDAVWPNIRILGLGGTDCRTSVGVATLDGIHAIAFVAAASYLDQFRQINLNGNHGNRASGHTDLTEAQLSSLCSAFPELRKLELARVMKTDDTVNSSTALFSKLVHLTSFSGVLYAGGQLRDGGLPELSAGGLRHLEIARDVEFDDTMSLWAPMLNHLTSLSVAFAECLDDDDFKMVLQHCTLLSSLDVRRGFIDDGEPRLVVAQLCGLPRLLNFRVCEPNFSARDLKEGCPQLEALDVSLCKVDDTTCALISEALPQLRKLFLGYNDNDTRTGLGMASEIEKPHPLTKEQTPWKGPGPMHWDAPHTRFTGLNRVTHVGFDALLDGCTNLRILELGSADVPDTMRERHHSTMALDKYWHDGGFKMRPWRGTQTTDGWDPLF